MNQTYLQLLRRFHRQGGRQRAPAPDLYHPLPGHHAGVRPRLRQSGYEAGAKEVVVRWQDEKLARIRMENGAEADLCDLKPYELRSWLDYAEDPDGCCTLAIHAEDPRSLRRVGRGQAQPRQPCAQQLPQALAGIHDERPHPVVRCGRARAGLGKKSLPRPAEAEAVEKLWALIFDVCRVSTGDPVAAWRDHVAKTKARRDQLNAWDLDRVRLQSANGTDLTIGLAEDATWEGASSVAENGAEFIANVPPRKSSARRTATASTARCTAPSPTPTTAQLIEGWHVTFKDGKVVEHGAEKNAELLAELLATDENAEH